MNNILKIFHPRVIRTKDDTVRLEVDIEEAGEMNTIYFEYENRYENYLSVDRVDFILYALLPVAIREGYDIFSEAPCSEIFLHNIRNVLLPSLIKGDSRAKSINIVCDTIRDSGYHRWGDAVGTGISCGVDSLYTLKKYTNSPYESLNITHLFLGNLNYELWNNNKEDTLKTWKTKYSESIERAQLVSDMTNKELILCYTNVLPYICRKRSCRIRHIEAHQYITMSAVLALRYLWKVYYFSSTFDFSEFRLTDNLTSDTAHYELLSMHTLAIEGFSAYSVGSDVDRIEKTIDLVDYLPAQKYLHPCNYGGLKNCSDPDCPSYKCLRALLTYDYYDRLDTMKDVFDIEKYKKNKKKYYWRTLRLKQDEFIAPLYKLINEKYNIDAIDDLTARIDIKAIGGSIGLKAYDNDYVDITKPNWLQEGGTGYMVVANGNGITIALQSNNEIELKVWLRGLLCIEEGKRIPKYIEYTKFEVDGFDYLGCQSKKIWHDAPYMKKVKISGNSIMRIEWKKA